MLSHPWIQIGITRSKDDADGPNKGLEEWQALRIRSQRGLEVARQGDESRKGRRRARKLGHHQGQQCSLPLLPCAELCPLPGEEPPGHLRGLRHRPGQGRIGWVSKESNELG